MSLTRLIQESSIPQLMHFVASKLSKDPNTVGLPDLEKGVLALIKGHVKAMDRLSATVDGHRGKALAALQGKIEAFEETLATRKSQLTDPTVITLLAEQIQAFDSFEEKVLAFCGTVGATRADVLSALEAQTVFELTDWATCDESASKDGAQAPSDTISLRLSQLSTVSSRSSVTSLGAKGGSTEQVDDDDDELTDGERVDSLAAHEPRSSLASDDGNQPSHAHSESSNTQAKPSLAQQYAELMALKAELPEESALEIRTRKTMAEATNAMLDKQIASLISDLQKLKFQQRQEQQALGAGEKKAPSIGSSGTSTGGDIRGLSGTGFGLAPSYYGTRTFIGCTFGELLLATPDEFVLKLGDLAQRNDTSLMKAIIGLWTIQKLQNIRRTLAATVDDAESPLAGEVTANSAIHQLVEDALRAASKARGADKSGNLEITLRQIGRHSAKYVDVITQLELRHKQTTQDHTELSEVDSDHFKALNLVMAKLRMGPTAGPEAEEPIEQDVRSLADEIQEIAVSVMLGYISENIAKRRDIKEVTTMQYMMRKSAEVVEYARGVATGASTQLRDTLEVSDSKLSAAAWFLGGVMEATGAPSNRLICQGLYQVFTAMVPVAESLPDPNLDKYRYLGVGCITEEGFDRAVRLIRERCLELPNFDRCSYSEEQWGEQLMPARQRAALTRSETTLGIL